MAHAELDIDIKQMVTSSSSFGPREIEQISNAIAESSLQYRTLRDALSELQNDTEPTPATRVRLGVCSYLIGRYSSAVSYLERADGGALAKFYLAKAHLALNQHEQAAENFAAAAKAGYDKGECALGEVEALRLQGKSEDALKKLDSLSGQVEQSAEYLYQRGATVAALGGPNEEVVALYERAVDADPNHPGALFGLALENDRHGNDEQALALYKKSAERFPPHLGTLVNLGLIYEDHEEYEQASKCFERVLRVFPDHPRVRMFQKDAESSKTMIYNEEEQARSDRMRQVMSVPVTDFELSVRSRNCLQRMGVNTLGDLTRITEQDLLGSKNFGETSLTEIKDMMTSKGLRLGQAVETKRAPEMTVDLSTMSPDEQAVLNKPVADLNLSVRARKCMIRLGINTIGELIRYTGDELLECKNFGVTSLNEVREKLTPLGLKLRGE